MTDFDPQTFEEMAGEEKTLSPILQTEILRRLIRAILQADSLDVITPAPGMETDWLADMLSGWRLDLLVELCDLNAQCRPPYRGRMAEMIPTNLSPDGRAHWTQLLDGIASPYEEIRSLLRTTELEATEYRALDPIYLLDPKDLPIVPPSQWRVANWLPDVGFMIFAGHPGAGKTIFAMHLALQLASGTSLIDHGVKPCGVCFVEAEGGKATFIRRWRLLGHGMALVKPIALIYDAIQLDDRKTLATLQKIIADDDLKVLILDPLSLLYGGKETDNDGIRRFVGSVINPLVAQGICVIAIHHLTKPQMDGGKRAEDDVFSIRGGGAWIGAADVCYLFMGSCRTCCTIEARKVRNEPVDTLYWKLDDLRPAEDRLTVCMTIPERMAELHQRLLELLSDGSAMSEAEIIKAIGGKRSLTIMALKRMASAADARLEFFMDRGRSCYRLRNWTPEGA